jgi:hypothetical protein
MPGFPFPGRVGPDLGEQLLDTMLTGQQVPSDAPEQAHVVAEMLASLAGPAGPGDLSGEEAARSAFARAASRATARMAARQPGRRAKGRLSVRLRAGLAVALLAMAAAIGGTAAAYAGVLPAPIQNLAHHAIGAPAARHSSAPAPNQRPAAYRLCTSYKHAQTRHNARALAAAARSLAGPAGGAGKIDTYCTAVTRSGAVPATPSRVHGKPRPAKASGKPADHGKQKAGKAKRHAKPKASPAGPGNGPNAHPPGNAQRPPGDQPNPSW